LRQGIGQDRIIIEGKLYRPARPKQSASRAGSASAALAELLNGNVKSDSRRSNARQRLVLIKRAGFNTSIAIYPDQRLTLRNGIQVIRKHDP